MLPALILLKEGEWGLRHREVGTLSGAAQLVNSRLGFNQPVCPERESGNLASSLPPSCGRNALWPVLNVSSRGTVSLLGSLATRWVRLGCERLGVSLLFNSGPEDWREKGTCELSSFQVCWGCNCHPLLLLFSR